VDVHPVNKLCPFLPIIGDRTRLWEGPTTIFERRESAANPRAPAGCESHQRLLHLVANCI